MIPHEKGIPRSNKRSEKEEIYLALNDIRSTHNVGSIFRTADAIGVNKIYTCGYTPSPVDRFGRARTDIAKSALGAEKNISWETADIKDLIKNLKKQKVKIIALEQDPRSIDYRDYKVIYDKSREVEKGLKTLLILGNEVGGINKEILDICDVVVEIPMYGKKESLNVSVATGIVLFGIFS